MNRRHPAHTHRDDADTIGTTVSRLAAAEALPGVCHTRLQGEPLPNHDDTRRIVELCRHLFFPGFFANSQVRRDNLLYHIGMAVDELRGILSRQIAAGLCFETECGTPTDMTATTQRADRLTMQFIEQLPAMRHLLAADAEATYRGDPAANSTEEVIFSYPGLRALTCHRIAHTLHRLGVPVIPRMISELAHSETGIDLHPGATIGPGLMIDHGTGVVVGATSIIGENVKIYQGVTLGARSFVRDADNNPVKGVPRHPIVGRDVVIYANTTILGRISIGDGAVIGGNLWVTFDVAPGERLVQSSPTNIVRLPADNRE
ncbi:MAG: serine acetyltransferase [Paramuribaculum sp.]|nr:serine acetyltransferase [Paramuribaculum sp.]